MKIRIKRDMTTPKGRLRTGDILDVKPSAAERWRAEGAAEPVKIIPREDKNARNI